MNRIILHIDMDYFFAQIEERENPQFRGKPVVVGADPKEGRGRGVVSTCNYEARNYGIHSALPISIAYKRCPHALFLPVNMELYKKVSKEVMEIVKKYSSKWEIVSLDEAYLDLSFLKKFESVKIIAEKLKRDILGKEKLTATIGMGPNKLLAKIAADKAKPNGLLMIKPSQVKSFLEPLDIEDLPGIGPKTAEKLRTLGVNKIKELKKISKSKLKEMLGKVGETFYENSRGIDETPVIAEDITKSVGREYTFDRDTRDGGVIFDTFGALIEEVYKELAANNFSFKTITVVCRFVGGDENPSSSSTSFRSAFETHTKSKTLEKAGVNFLLLQKEAKKLLLKFIIANQKPIRLIGLRVKV